MGRLHAISAVVALVLAASGPPSAAAGPRALWATVNVCDTAGHPDAIGIRGSMPGSGGRSVRMRMRFRLQYRVSPGRWQALRSGGDSGWVAVGSGRVRAGQTGQTFTLMPPGAGRAYVLRGLVTFQWRRGRQVVARARRVTTAGHGATKGADPSGFSAGTCRIS